MGSTEWAEDFGSFLGDNGALTRLSPSVNNALILGSRCIPQSRRLSLRREFRRRGVSCTPSIFLLAVMMNSDQSLAWLLRGAAEDILTDANASHAVWDTRGASGNWKEWRLSALGIEEQDYEDLAASGTGVAALGRVSKQPRGSDHADQRFSSGSDFTPFLQRYGVSICSDNYLSLNSHRSHLGTSVSIVRAAVITQAATKTVSDGPHDAVYHYHSIYDSFNWMER